MNNSYADILDESLAYENLPSRKQLTPTFIIIFSWIFLVLSAMVPIVLIVGIVSDSVDLSLYGLDAYTPYSALGAFITLLFAFKGVVAYGFIRRMEWAVDFAIVDAIAGIAVCIFVMAYSIIMGGGFSFRLELIALIPYLLKALKIKQEWKLAYK